VAGPLVWAKSHATRRVRTWLLDLSLL